MCPVVKLMRTIIPCCYCYLYYFSGIHDEAAIFYQMGFGEDPAECVVAKPVPDECPFNILKCECGATISFWAFFDADQSGLFLVIHFNLPITTDFYCKHPEINALPTRLFDMQYNFYKCILFI